ncbi:MAG: hypothetical protein IT301_17195 [Dehalococcoidia bacterium]|nr:hypothetical protein [Dehalococcoidia bacterium]
MLKTIEAFNRKERFFLFAYATGNDSRGLVLSPVFRASLGAALGLEVPPEARGFVDYHIDWLHAAVLLESAPAGANSPNWQPGTAEPAGQPTVPWVSTGNQEDIDLLVVFERDGVTWLLLVEAKAETEWTNKQVRSKAERFRRIFGSASIDPAAPVQPRFCLMSPHRPQGLTAVDGEAWPAWMVGPGVSDRRAEFAWAKLAVPTGRRKVTGCDANGTPSRARKYWTVTEVGAADAVVE